MIFAKTAVEGAYVVDLETRGDERGFFARTYCASEFTAAGLAASFVQANMSFSRSKGTLRGLHYQLAPNQEAKLVRCVRGAAWDVVLDIRPDSPTFGVWTAAELSADNRRAMYAPPGAAHGFITLTDDCEITYLVSACYAPELERGVRWDDPRFAIDWPLEPTVISDRDRAHPDFETRQAPR